MPSELDFNSRIVPRIWIEGSTCLRRSEGGTGLRYFFGISLFVIRSVQKNLSVLALLAHIVGEMIIERILWMTGRGSRTHPARQETTDMYLRSDENHVAQ